MMHDSFVDNRLTTHRLWPSPKPRPTQRRCRFAPAWASCCSTRKDWCSSAVTGRSGRRSARSYVGDAVWQLPQGGIEPREPSRETAFRELWEETGVRNASLIAEIPGWLTYQLPPELLGIALKGKYAGHRLRWYAMRFEGDDSEIDIGPKGSMIKPEFDAWRWVPLADVPSLAIDFRRTVYEEVVQEFARFAPARRRSARGRRGVGLRLPLPADASARRPTYPPSSARYRLSPRRPAPRRGAARWQDAHHRAPRSARRSAPAR